MQQQQRRRQIKVLVPRDPAWASEAAPPLADPPSAVVTWGGAPGIWLVELDANQSVVLYTSKGGSSRSGSSSPPPPFVIRPVAANTTEENWFGYRRPMQPLH